MTMLAIEYPKTPRWISTEAGEWAWREQTDWRGVAGRALSVQERTRLLQEAETLWNSTGKELRVGSDEQ